MSWWTNKQVALLRAEYPQGGAIAVWTLLKPDEKKSLQAINRKAIDLKIKRETPTSNMPIASSPQIDSAIRKIGKGMTVSEVSRRFGRPSPWIRRRAQKLKVELPGRTGRPWTGREDELLEETVGLGLHATLARFCAAGFDRSPGAILSRRKGRKLSNRRDLKDQLRLGHLAALLGVHADAVSRWTKLRDDPLRETALANGHRLIKEADFREWVGRNPHRLDLGKMPRTSYAWFVELLTGIVPEASLD